MPNRPMCWALTMFVLVHPRGVSGQVPPVEDLFRVGLDSLLNIEVISVSRKLEGALTAPGTVYAVTGEEIERYRFLLLQEVLEYVPSVYLYDPHSWVWGGQRGLVSNFSQTLLQVNGREVNNLIAQEGFISRQFATHAVERIEVVASPGSALHGANALAGVINIVTKDADPSYEGFEIDVEGGSYNTTALSLLFGRRFEDVGVRASFRQFNSDEEDFLDFVRDTASYSSGWSDNGIALPSLTDYDNASAATTISLQVDRGGLYGGVYAYRNRQSHGLETRRWDYTASEDNRDFRLLYGGFSGALSSSLDVRGEVQHVSSSLWGRYHAGFWPVARLEASGTLDLFTFPERVVTSSGERLEGEEQIRAFYPSFAHYLVDQGLLDPANASESDVDRYLTHVYSNRSGPGSQRRRADLITSWRASERLTLDVGYAFDYIDYAGLAVTDAGSGIAATVDVPLDRSKRLDVYRSVKHGGYAQVNAQLEERVALNVGARVDHQNHYGSTFNPRVGLVIRADPATVVKALYGEAFREPNVFELSGDPDSEPAKLHGVELNVVRSLGEVARVTLAGYRNQVSDFLGSVGSLIGTGVGSVTEQSVSGAEMRLDVTRGPFIGFATGSLIFDSKQTVESGSGGETSVEVLGIPRARLGGGGWLRLSGHTAATALYRWVNGYEALSGNSAIAEPFEIGAANQLDVTFQVTGVSAGESTIDAFLKMMNVTDATFYQANIRRSGPHKFLGSGRSVHLGLSVR